MQQVREGAEPLSVALRGGRGDACRLCEEECNVCTSFPHPPLRPQKQARAAQHGRAQRSAAGAQHSLHVAHGRCDLRLLILDLRAGRGRPSRACLVSMQGRPQTACMPTQGRSWALHVSARHGCSRTSQASTPRASPGNATAGNATAATPMAALPRPAAKKRAPPQPHTLWPSSSTRYRQRTVWLSAGPQWALRTWGSGGQHTDAVGRPRTRAVCSAACQPEAPYTWRTFPQYIRTRMRTCSCAQPHSTAPPPPTCTHNSPTHAPNPTAPHKLTSRPAERPAQRSAARTCGPCRRW